MNEILSDIRILKLAEMYERTYEAFVLEMAAKYVQDAKVKESLAKLAGPSDKHGERISAHLERLNGSLGEVDRASLERAALQDILEVERSARAFYLRFVEEVRDPEVAELFRELAREEGGHIRIAEGALALNGRKTGRSKPDTEAERRLRMLDDAPSWEGTSDFRNARPRT